MRSGIALRSGVCALALLTAGCSIPKDGPTGRSVTGGATVAVRSTQSLNYLMTDLTPVSMHLANNGTLASTLKFPSLSKGAGPDVSIGVGDIVAITIFESEAGGLFIPKEAGSRSGNFVQIPNQQVDASGNITVPYVDGPVRVAGRTARAVSAQITEKLKSRAVEPQAVVSVVEHRSNDVSVLGEVNTSLQFSIDPGGVKLLNAIARAGGPKYPAYETTVTLQRNGVINRAWMSAVVKDPSQNEALRPGDVIYLAHDPRVFMALGATPSPGSVGGLNNRRFSFENETMTLAEAVAKAGGLDTTRADPKAVFLFRFEAKDAMARAGMDVSRFPGAVVPVVYRTDMSNGGGLFLSNSFLMRDRDILFVAEDQSAELQRFLSIVNGITSNAQNIAGTAVDARTAISGTNFSGL